MDEQPTEPTARDLRAEEWLRSAHGPDWYIGDATLAEWEAAYDAVDEMSRNEV